VARLARARRAQTRRKQSAATSHIDKRKTVIEQAADLARRWRTLAAPEKRTLLHALVAQIDVRAETVNITVRLAALPAIVRPDLDLGRLPLLADTSYDHPVGPGQSETDRHGDEPAHPGRHGPACREPDRSLLRLLGQARRFNDMVMNGRGTTITDLAAEAGVSPSYFTRIYRLSLLAPTSSRPSCRAASPQS
jgi:site-specific DNA recombinase